MRIRIRHITLMRIRIQVSKMMQIHADPDPQHRRTVTVLVACPKNKMMLGLKSNKIYLQNIKKLIPGIQNCLLFCIEDPKLIYLESKKTGIL
jgi:hypothetical protein